jgi:hypothetical protein
MLTDVLRSGFVLAHRRIGLIFLDVLWKGIWLVLTACTVMLALLWITSDLRGLAWEDTGVRSVNTTVAAALLRGFWNSKGGEILSILFGVLFVSAAIWIFLEAFFRRKIVRDLSDPSPAYTMLVFLASGVFRGLALVACVFIFARVWFAGAVAIAIVMAVAIVFFLTLLDSLIRADAVELLGTDLFRVSGLLGILMSFESMIAASFVVILIAGFVNVTRPLDALVMLGAACVAVLFLSFLHSYLLLVRFSAIAIMRRNVVEV